jgi:hypothetical protein
MKKTIVTALISVGIGIGLGVLFTLPSTNSNNDKSSTRYKAGQSDKEICVRNYAGTESCMDDAKYSKFVANIMKNGGCTTSVPDMGYMYRDWQYCKTAYKKGERVIVLYLPSGEILRLEDAYVSSSTMSDDAYQKEMQEYEQNNK